MKKNYFNNGGCHTYAQMLYKRERKNVCVYIYIYNSSNVT